MSRSATIVAPSSSAKPERCRHGVHLVAQRAVADAHVAGHAGHSVDDARVWTADVDDDRRLDDVAARERDAAYATVSLVDPHHGLVEAERRAMVAGGERQVVGGQHRVVDEPAPRAVERGQVTCRIVGEGRIVDALRWPETPRVEPGEALADLGWVESFVRDPDVVPQRHDAGPVVALGAEDQVPGAHEASHPVGIVGSEVLGPRLPYGGRFPRSQDRVERRVAEADDRRRGTRRAGAGRGSLVDTDHRATAAGQLVGDGGADHPRPDDDRVCLLRRSRLIGEQRAAPRRGVGDAVERERMQPDDAERFGVRRHGARRGRSGRSHRARASARPTPGSC